MDNKVFLIKLVHSLIFFLMMASLLYILYSVITATFNLLLLFALAALFIEGITLILNNWRCPMAGLAERYGSESGTVTDIFLPSIIARNSFRIFSVVFALELILLAIRYLLN
ncbi:MAG: hypothetical protein V3S02_03220 [Dehalococcoidales bacterium]